MKRISKYLLPILLLTIFFTACKKNPADVDGPFVVKLYGCNGDKNSTSPYICFDSLLTESRCLTCIWSGYALIKVGFHENGNTHVFKMVTPLLHWYDASGDTTINGYHIVLKTLLPYPSITNRPISNDDIKATIEITR